MSKSDDVISRQAAIDALRYAQHRFTVADEAGGMGTVKWSENVIYVAAAENVLADLPTAQPERKKGEWIEKHHAYSDEESAIEEWQSCKCSVCGRYDTRPYQYYFDEPHFCSWCGADMRGEGK